MALHVFPLRTYPSHSFLVDTEIFSRIFRTRRPCAVSNRPSCIHDRRPHLQYCMTAAAHVTIPPLRHHAPQKLPPAYRHSSCCGSTVLARAVRRAAPPLRPPSARWVGGAHWTGTRSNLQPGHAEERARTWRAGSAHDERRPGCRRGIM